MQPDVVAYESPVSRPLGPRSYWVRSCSMTTFTQAPMPSRLLVLPTVFTSQRPGSASHRCGAAPGGLHQYWSMAMSNAAVIVVIQRSAPRPCSQNAFSPTSFVISLKLPIPKILEELRVQVIMLIGEEAGQLPDKVAHSPRRCPAGPRLLQLMKNVAMLSGKVWRGSADARRHRTHRCKFLFHHYENKFYYRWHRS